MKLAMKPIFRLVAVHTPAVVPIQWEEKVKNATDVDINLSVNGLLLAWCHRMVVTRKHNGGP